MEGIKNSSTGTCGYMWSNNSSFQQQQKVSHYFIDDFSRKIWVYFLTNKLEAFATFKICKAKVEKESGAFIRSLRTDRGGEFTSSAFNSFCNENGIFK